MAKIVKFTGVWHLRSREGAPIPVQNAPRVSASEQEVNRVRILSWHDLGDDESITYDADPLSFWREALDLRDPEGFEKRIKVETAVFAARKQFIDMSTVPGQTKREAKLDLAIESFKIGVLLHCPELQNSALDMLEEFLLPDRVHKIAADLRIEVRRELLALNGRLRT